MAALLPVKGARTETCSRHVFAFDPYSSEADRLTATRKCRNTFHCKTRRRGCDYQKAYLTFQEYFEHLRKEPKRWGKPFAALLGALEPSLASI
jgi:phosphoribosylformylglycinamidine synthase